MLKPEDQSEDSARNGYDFLKSSLSGIITPDVRSKIDNLIQEVASLKDVEKLLFCLLLPVESSHGVHGLSNTSFGLTGDDLDVSSSYDVNALGVGIFSPGGQSSLHLSNQVEQSQAYTWIVSHLEENPSTCLRKHEVYDDYRAYCEKHHMKTLNTADFGKVMKRAFPNVKPRRLGQRGQSRYCYGGMRKKTESQPPFLPDLTNEALGMASQNTVSRSAASPGSSSGGSFEANSQINISSSSPLIRLLKSNGPDIDLVSWADDPSIRSALGIRGSIVADVAHILLEYAHQVFGVQFKSLFQLAQHLVTNRYVNSRSKHAFALIAHAANPPVSFSPPPSTALAEVLQKGAVKSAFDKIRNGRQNSAASDSSYRSECIKLEGFHTPISTNNSSPANALSQSSVSDNRSANLSTSIPNRGMNNHGMPTLTSSTPYSTVQMSHCSTAQRVVDNKPYESNTAALSQNSCVSSYTASVLASPSALQSSNQHLSNYPFTLTQNLRNNSFNHPYSHTGSSGLTHPSTAMALAAAAAVAAHQKHQSGAPNFSPNVFGSNFSSPLGQITGPVSPSVDSRHITANAVSTPPAAHREKHSGILETSTPTTQSDSVYSNLSGYHSPITGNSMYAAHQHTSPYPRPQQPPAPLPPGVGARSPYAQVSHLSATNTDSSQSGFKRTVPPHPGEAPGAYEPSPRFHLGGQSPSKRARYLSTASGSSTLSLSTDGPPLSGGSCPDGSERLSDQVTPTLDQNNSVAAPSPSSSGGSSSNPTHIPPNPSGYSGPCAAAPRQYCVNNLDQSSSMPSPYYPGRYEGLEMHSPAPPPHGHIRSHHASNNTGSSSSQWNVPGLLPSTNKINSFDQQQSDYLMNSRCQNYNSNLSVSTSDRTSLPTVFRPPITPFTLELEGEEDGENLPRLGTSPGPQIPPSSPTEFLPFYSEAANKSAQAQLRQKQLTELTPRVHNTPDSDDRGTNSDNSSPCITLVNMSRPDARNNPQMTSAEYVTTPMTNPVSHSDELLSPSLSDSNDRTLTILDNLGEVNTPPMPDGLADAPSPSEAMKENSLVRKREELQHELSTPGPSDRSRSPSCPNNVQSSVQIPQM